MWYLQYKRYSDELASIQKVFFHKCRELSVEPMMVVGPYLENYILDSVRQSNWHEGLYLSPSQARRMLDFAKVNSVLRGKTGLDLNEILGVHYENIEDMISHGFSVEQIAYHNMIIAHQAVDLIAYEFEKRFNARILQSLNGARKYLQEQGGYTSDNDETLAEINAILESETINDTELIVPFGEGIKTVSDLTRFALDQERHTAPLDFRISIDHLHFLHKIVMAGVMPLEDCGAYRQEYKFRGFLRAGVAGRAAWPSRQQWPRPDRARGVADAADRSR
jgi:hypothetical protein